MTIGAPTQSASKTGNNVMGAHSVITFLIWADDNGMSSTVNTSVSNNLPHSPRLSITSCHHISPCSILSTVCHKLVFTAHQRVASSGVGATLKERTKLERG